MTRIIFFGSEQFAVKILQSLVVDSENFSVVAVVTQPSRPVGRKQTLTQTPVATYATEQRIKILAPTSLKAPNIHSELQKFEADVFVVAQYGLIIPQAILEIPHFGAVNVHASILPRHRGATPVQGALLAGDNQTGVSIMVMDALMDHGPIINIHPCDISPTDTIKTLMDTLATCASENFSKDLLGFIHGEIEPIEQNHDVATFTKIMTRQTGFIDWSSMDAIQIERMTRALVPWPGVTFSTEKQEYKIIAAHVARTDEVLDEIIPAGIIRIARGSILLVGTISGAISIDIIQPAGKNQMTASECCRGYASINNAVCINSNHVS